MRGGTLAKGRIVLVPRGVRSSGRCVGVSVGNGDCDYPFPSGFRLTDRGGYSVTVVCGSSRNVRVGGFSRDVAS